MEPFCEVWKLWSQFLSGRQANENWSLSNFRPRNAEADVNSSGSSVPPHTQPHTDPQQLGTLVVVWSRPGFIDCMYLKTQMEFHPGTVSQNTLFFSFLLLFFYFFCCRGYYTVRLALFSVSACLVCDLLSSGATERVWLRFVVKVCIPLSFVASQEHSAPRTGKNTAGTASMVTLSHS